MKIKIVLFKTKFIKGWLLNYYSYAVASWLSWFAQKILTSGGEEVNYRREKQVISTGTECGIKIMGGKWGPCLTMTSDDFSQLPRGHLGYEWDEWHCHGHNCGSRCPGTWQVPGHLLPHLCSTWHRAYVDTVMTKNTTLSEAKESQWYGYENWFTSTIINNMQIQSHIQLIQNKGVWNMI